MKKKIRLAALIMAAALTFNGCGIIGKDSLEDESKKEETDKKETAKKEDTDKNNKKKLEKYIERLVEFVEENISYDTQLSNASKQMFNYKFNDASILEDEDETYEEGVSCIVEYQLADINDDEKPELVLKYDTEIESYGVIVYEEDEEFKISKPMIYDNQGTTILTDYADAVAIYKEKDGNDKKIIVSGAIGSGAENFYFVYEINEADYTAKEMFSCLDEYPHEKADCKVDEKECEEDEFLNKLEEFENEYELENGYTLKYMPENFTEALKEELTNEDKEDEKKVEDKEWKNAYAQVLEKLSEEDGSTSFDEYTFMLKCIDEDEIPELLVTAGASIASTVEIFTFYNGKAVSIGNFGMMGTVSCTKNGLINSGYFNHGNDISVLYSLKNGTAVKKISMAIYENTQEYEEAGYEGDITYTYCINALKVTKEKYDKFYEQYFSEDFIEYNVFEGNTITKENIETVFNEFTESTSSESENKSDDNKSKATSTPAKTETASPTATPNYDGSKELQIKSAEVSSVLSDQYGNSYQVTNLYDSNLSTAWAEGSSSNGVNESITVWLDKEQMVSAISLLNGYGKSEDLYYKNCRIKSAQLTFSDGSTTDVSFSDGIIDKEQKVSFDAVSTEFVKITVKEVFSGSKYTDLCVSEVGIYQ